MDRDELPERDENRQIFVVVPVFRRLRINHDPGMPVPEIRGELPVRLLPDLRRSLDEVPKRIEGARNSNL